MKSMEVNDKFKLEVDEDKNEVVLVSKANPQARQMFTLEQWETMVAFVGSNPAAKPYAPPVVKSGSFKVKDETVK